MVCTSNYGSESELSTIMQMYYIKLPGTAKVKKIFSSFSFPFLSPLLLLIIVVSVIALLILEASDL